MRSIITLILLSFCLYGYKGQSSVQFLEDKNQKEDTLYIKSLKNEMYKNEGFKVLQVYSFEKDRMSIRILKNGGVIGSIDLPNGNEVSNFSFLSVQENPKDGFVLSSVFGEIKLGRDRATFFFTYDGGTFYLEKADVIKPVQGESKLVRTTGLKVPIDQFVITNYLK